MRTNKQKLRSECDSAWKEIVLQRADFKCEICGGTFRITGHHFYPRGLYGHLRYNPENGVALDFPCHFAHHHRGDPSIHDKIIAKRGMEWYDNLKESAYNRPKSSFQTIGYYQGIKDKLNQELND